MIAGHDPAEFGGLALALALGLLIGVQRGWALRRAAPGTRFAGIRTFALLGLAGGLAGTLNARFGAMATVMLGATAALVVAGYWRSTRGGTKVSGTASLVGLIALAAGFVAGSGEFALASAVTGVTVLLLSLRTPLHHWLTHIDETEMIAIARFALIALVILPILPDTPMGPYEAWRPRQLWLVVVLVSGFSLAGYAAARVFGQSRGVLATALAGSLVSSTAVTASLAGKLKQEAGDTALLNAGIALAGAVMFARVMTLTALLASFALPTLAILAAPGLLVSLIAALVLLRGQSPTPGPVDLPVALRNPFDIRPALLLMALTMLLTLVARWMLQRYGDAGLASVLAVSGMIDVDSAIITMGNLPPGSLAPGIAGLVLLPPILLNTLFKTATALSIAGWRRCRSSALTLIASVIASCLMLPFAF